MGLHSSEVEFAWACGLFEGEGALGVFKNCKRTNAHICTIQLVMADEEIVRRFHRIVGAGVVEGPLNYKSSKKLLFRWRMRGTYKIKADLVRRMWPFLSGYRRSQGQAILDFEQRLDANKALRSKG